MPVLSLVSQDCTNMDTQQGQTQKRTAERDMVKNHNNLLRRRSTLDFSHGERQRLRHETGQFGGGGSVAPFYTRRGGIDDDDDVDDEDDVEDDDDDDNDWESVTIKSLATGNHKKKGTTHHTLYTHFYCS